MRAFIKAGFVGSLIMLCACRPVDVLNRASPSRFYESRLSVPYSDEARNTLDVYVPEKRLADAPLVVFFYGGGWRGGSKEDYEFVASSLTKAGAIVIIPDYRLYPEVMFPTFIEDSAAAVAWSIEHAAELGARVDNLFLAGHSAGAHIAALLALDPSYLGSNGIATNDVAGLIGMSGPYNFLPLKQAYLKEVFPEQSRSSSQPINFVSASAPPTLLIHGTRDKTVLPANSTSFADALRAAGANVDVNLYDYVGHVKVVATLAPPLDFLARTIEDSLAFIRQTCPVKPCLAGPAED